MEYCFKAATTAGYTVVAVRGQSCVVVITQKKLQDRLMDYGGDKDMTTHLYATTPQTGVCVTGTMADCKAFVQRTRYETQKFQYDYGLIPTPLSLQAERMADLAQVNTQTASMRPLAVLAIYVGMDHDDPQLPLIYKVDCAGHFLPFSATAAGPKEQEAMNYLEKRIDEFATASLAQTVRTAIACLGHVLGSDFRSKEIEIAQIDGAATADPATKGKFHVLTEDEIEVHLNAMADDADT
jgi:20S proteasome subunit alpha 1